MATHFARLHRRQHAAALQAQIIEVACAMALVLMAATAGYLAHMPTTCTDTVQVDVD